LNWPFLAFPIAVRFANVMTTSVGLFRKSSLDFVDAERANKGRTCGIVEDKNMVDEKAWPDPRRSR
jgi:hypothetical protein